MHYYYYNYDIIIIIVIIITIMIYFPETKILKNHSILYVVIML